MLLILLAHHGGVLTIQSQSGNWGVGDEMHPSPSRKEDRVSLPCRDLHFVPRAPTPTRMAAAP